MSETVSESVRRAKLLPPDDWGRLVDELLVSPHDYSAAELDAAWSAEIERRLAACDRGDARAVSADEVLAKAQAIAR
jgi:putative addiction module component (TIGR02574 family)